MHTSRAFTRYIVVWLCLAFVFAFGLIHLKSDPIAVAEFNSTKHIYEKHLGQQFSIAFTVSRVASQDPSHTPGYFVLLNLWSRLVGRDPFALRALSLLIGMLTLAFTYRLVLLLSSREVALDAALMLSFLAFFMFYTHEVRMYALMAMLSAWIAWSYWRVVSLPHTVKWRHWLSLFVSASTILYIHYFGVLLLGAIGVYHLVFQPKNRHWIKCAGVLLAAGTVFLPWTPVALKLLSLGSSWGSDHLSSLGALTAITAIFSNGSPLLAPAVAAVLTIRRKQLNASNLYIMALVFLVMLFIVLANEIASVVFAKRIRYTIILGPLWIGAMALGLNLIPRWRLLRLPALLVWIATFFIYNNSADLYLYTSGQSQNKRQVPHFQNLLYEPDINPRKSDYVLSFHTNTALNDNKIIEYYGRQLGVWRGLIHIWNDEAGNPIVQSTDTRYRDVTSMVSWNFPIWLIYNPQETDLGAMDVFSGSFLAHFHSCGPYLESDNSIIELYVKSSIPCKLLVSQHPIELQYDNGTALENILLEQVPDALTVYFWWENTIANQYAFSLQLFDSNGEKARQLDAVIGGDLITRHSLALSNLPPDEYVAKLIVYSFQSKASQPGIIVASGQAFEREVEIASLSIGD